ncbi:MULTISPECIES: helix-turn-helix domain-containing protein [unclassified Cupriavidus]|nr:MULTISPECIES: helix-turn-helix domain-containing protein [unclassified Cupriavidus]MBP0631787.1 helix-turn-helix domain-containing protein [Cupriavidus sp. AcVe19-1a]MBP0639516.1 helix-turn-helix domain-containing protein [Cupriavidus sp. AcVe19-6a]
MTNAYLLVLPKVHMLDLGGPLQILSSVSELGIAPLRVRCAGPHSSVTSFQGPALGQVERLPARVAPGDVVLAIGSKLLDTLTTSPAWRDSAAWLRETFADGRNADVQVGAVCTGAFLLGAAGLLDGRLCTTHHAHTRRLRARHPAASVVDNRVFVRDGNMWTSAGVASGIDLALRLVADAYGDDAAIAVARDNVVPFRRFSGDPQLAPQFRARSHGNALVHAVQDAIARELDANVADPRFADRFAISVRHLSRIFHEETGLTPKQYQLTLRMARARKLLASSSLAVEEIALKSGFASVQAFRACWNKAEPATPSAYRLATTGNPQTV